MRRVLPPVIVRNTRPEDFGGIAEVCRLVYPDAPPWKPEQLASHLRVFPEGQLVAVEGGNEQVLGMAASLIILWAEYDMSESWRDFTDQGMFTNHDPSGRTLYGAEVLVHPGHQRRRIGSRLYRARRELVERLGLLRIRAGARLRGYRRVAKRMSAEEYVVRVVRGELRDPTLTFQLRNGFHVLGVVSDYLGQDPESLGHAAVIEWVNPVVAKPEDLQGRDPRYQRPVAVETPSAPTGTVPPGSSGPPPG
jgi:ribosomal protein S18 acetylase RimI-like enzyme